MSFFTSLRLDAAVPERALGFHEVAPEVIVDPIGEGLAHDVRAEVSGGPGCGDRPVPLAFLANFPRWPVDPATSTVFAKADSPHA